MLQDSEFFVHLRLCRGKKFTNKTNVFLGK